MPQGGPWHTVRDHLIDRIPALGAAGIDAQIAAGQVVGPGGVAITADSPFVPRSVVWMHRDVEPEVEVPFEIGILYRDERIVVADKPHFLATAPRGRHIRQSVTARLRVALELPELSPAHRLDRLTAGVLLLTTQQRWRGAYQELFASGAVRKRYAGLSAVRADLREPATVALHLSKPRGALRCHIDGSATPNASTVVALVEDRDGVGSYDLRPLTGRTHQLRATMWHLGIPLFGDPLYPVIIPDEELDHSDFSAPLQLLARELSFVDPIDGARHTFVSRQVLSGK